MSMGIRMYIARYLHAAYIEIFYDLATSEWHIRLHTALPVAVT